MAQNTGLLSAADALLHTDALASVYRSASLNLAATLTLAKTAQKTIAGDGTTTFPGLSNIDMKAAIKGSLPGLPALFDLTRIWASQYPLMSALDNAVQNNIPGTWNFLNGASPTHFFDQYLTRINAAWGSPVAAVPTAGALTAGYNVAGGLPSTTSGNAPRLVHTLIGLARYNESLPSAEATQVALTGSQNSYSYQIASTVPIGVTQVGLYRGVFAGATSFYYWLKDITVTPGAAYPAMLITEGDAFLRTDIVPPSWLCAMMTPEFAAMFALSFAGGAFGSAATSLVSPILLVALNMLSPGNVVLNPANGVLGVGNTGQGAEFGRSVITGSGAQTWTPGTIQSVNSPSANVQGFAGALKLQSRMVAALGAGATFTLSYTYYDAAHGWGVAQTQTAVSVVHVTGALGEVIAIPVTAGRIVVGIPSISAVSGAATTGSVVIEAANPRF